MKLEIRGLKIEITDSLRTYAQRRLAFALDRFAERIRTVRLKLDDMNGQRGGVDKRCQLAISLAHSSSITLESRASTVQGAVDRIASKVRSSIERRFMRKQEQRRFRKADRRPFALPPLAIHRLRGGSAP
jgi:ribosome hibernation promoting factor